MSVELVLLIVLAVAVVVFAFTFIVMKGRTKEVEKIIRVQPEAEPTTRIEKPLPKPKSQLAVQLLVVDPHGERHTEDILNDEFSIGREKNNDLILDPEDLTASRYHAKIEKEGDGKKAKYYIRDLGTKAGTKLNNDEIVREELKDKDKIVIGKTQMEFNIHEFKPVA